MGGCPMMPNKTIRKHQKTFFLKKIPLDVLKIDIFGNGPPKQWQKNLIWMWNFFLNLGSPERQCRDWGRVVNCPTRWSLYCPLGICIDHLFHNPYLKWNIVHQCTRVLCYTVPGKFIRELIRLILTSANWLQSLLGSHTIRATRAINA